MTVSLSQVLASARARSAPLAGECAGYLVLAAADHAARGPRRIEPGSVELHADGSVRVVGGLPADEATTERDLRDLLDELLLVAGSVTPALLRSARRRTGVGIDGFVREIETALIPVNRAAARRALSRLERETARAVERGGLVIENQRTRDRALAPEPSSASVSSPVDRPQTPPPASLTPPPLWLTPPPASLTPSPLSLTPPPVFTRQQPVAAAEPPPSALPSQRPATDLLPTPVAVPVRSKRVLEPLFEETPSKLETRPETVLARVSRRPPAKPSRPVWAPAKSDERLHEPLIASPAPPPISVSPCALPPVESMTPFLGTATAQRVQAPVVAAPLLEGIADESIADAGSADEGMAEAMADAGSAEDGVAEGVSADASVALDDIAEDDIVEESPDEFTEPFYLDGDGSEEVGLAFHELTTLMASVGPVAEPVIELAESPAPAADVEAAPSAVEEMGAEARAVAEASAPAEDVVVAEAAEVDVPVEVDVPDMIEVDIPDVVEAIGPDMVEVDIPDMVEAVPPAPPRGEFDDVELAVMLPSAEPPPVMMRRPATDPAALLPRRPLPQQRTSNVDELLQSFGHGSAEGGEEADVRSTLKRLAGLEPTPPPPDTTRR